MSTNQYASPTQTLLSYRHNESQETTEGKGSLPIVLARNAKLIEKISNPQIVKAPNSTGKPVRL